MTSNLALDTMDLPCFGLHQNKQGIYYLFQDLNPKGFDFRGQPSHSGLTCQKISGKCPHAMNPYLRVRFVPKRHKNAFDLIRKDPLVKAMMPIPGEFKGGHIYQINAERLPNPLPWLKTLERMSSPNYSQVTDINSQSIKYLKNALHQTNLQPMAVTGVNGMQKDLVLELISEARTTQRTLVIVSDFTIPGVTEIDSNLPDLLHLNDLLTLSLEHIGMRMLSEFVDSGVEPWEK